MSDTVTCPLCGCVLTDLYEHGWANHNGEQWVEIDCPQCDNDLQLYREVEITYKVTGVKAKEGKKWLVPAAAY